MEQQALKAILVPLAFKVLKVHKDLMALQEILVQLVHKVPQDHKVMQVFKGEWVKPEQLVKQVPQGLKAPKDPKDPKDLKDLKDFKVQQVQMVQPAPLVKPGLKGLPV